VRYLAVKIDDGWLIVIAEDKKKSNALQSDIRRASKIGAEVRRSGIDGRE
jgi:hypothetical protein